MFVTILLLPAALAFEVESTVPVPKVSVTIYGPEAYPSVGPVSLPQIDIAGIAYYDPHMHRGGQECVSSDGTQVTVNADSCTGGLP